MRFRRRPLATFCLVLALVLGSSLVVQVKAQAGVAGLLDALASDGGSVSAQSTTTPAAGSSSSKLPANVYAAAGDATPAASSAKTATPAASTATTTAAAAKTATPAATTPKPTTTATATPAADPAEDTPDPAAAEDTATAEEDAAADSKPAASSSSSSSSKLPANVYAAAGSASSTTKSSPAPSSPSSAKTSSPTPSSPAAKTPASSPSAASKTPAAASPGALPTVSDSVSADPVALSKTAAKPTPKDDLPPGPPDSWAYLNKDSAVVFGMQLRGPYITPWTQPKTYILTKTLKDRYLRSVAQDDIDVQVVNTFTYMSYDNPNMPATGTTGRRLMQAEKTGANIRLVWETSAVRAGSEIEALQQGIASGTLAKDLSMSGLKTDNVTQLDPPQVKGVAEVQDTSTSGSLEGWAIGVIVAVVLLLLPVPVYFYVRYRRRKHAEALARVQQEQAASRARMESRMSKQQTGFKSVSLHGGPGVANIMVTTGSAGGLVPAPSSRSYSQASMPRAASSASLEPGAGLRPLNVPPPGASGPSFGSARQV